MPNCYQIKTACLVVSNEELDFYHFRKVELTLMCPFIIYNILWVKY